MNVPHDANLEFVWQVPDDFYTDIIGELVVACEATGKLRFRVFDGYDNDATVTLSLEQVAEVRKVLGG